VVVGRDLPRLTPLAAGAHNAWLRAPCSPLPHPAGPSLSSHPAVLIVLTVEYFFYFLLAIWLDHVLPDENGERGVWGRAGGPRCTCVPSARATVIRGGGCNSPCRQDRQEFDLQPGWQSAGWPAGASVAECVSSGCAGRLPAAVLLPPSHSPWRVVAACCCRCRRCAQGQVLLLPHPLLLVQQRCGLLRRWRRKQVRLREDRASRSALCTLRASPLPWCLLAVREDPLQPPHNTPAPVCCAVLCCRGVRTLRPPLARAAELDLGMERDSDVVAEERRMQELAQHRTGKSWWRD
jgi:hypothetical protein